MKKLGTGKMLNETEYKIIAPGEKTIRQKFPMLEIEAHFFKKANDDEIRNFKLKDANIKCVYNCCHNSSKCRCKVILFENNTAKMLGAHIFDTCHLNDIFSYRRVIVRNIIKKK